MDGYIEKYRSKGILVDTNLLLLMLIGGVSRSYITQFKRTQLYSPEDYDLLIKVLDKFACVVVTPNLLTEVSNLSNGLSGPRLKQFYEVFAKALSVMQEKYIESVDLTSYPGFYAYGLADAGIVAAAKENYLVLTDV